MEFFEPCISAVVMKAENHDAYTTVLSYGTVSERLLTTLEGNNLKPRTYDTIVGAKGLQMFPGSSGGNIKLTLARTIVVWKRERAISMIVQ